MTSVAWREDDFEERGFDPRMFASGGANASIIEEQPCYPFWKQGAGDIFCIGPVGKLVIGEAKVDPNRQREYVVIWPQSWNRGWTDHQNLFSIQWHVDSSLIDTAVVLSRSSIDEPSRQVERSASVSSSYANLSEDDEQRNVAAIHPLTRPVYKQLAEIPAPTREAIQDILQRFASSVSDAVSRKLPSLRLASLEDESYLLEWTFADRRLGFSFEPNPKESGWYFVLSTDSSERYESGTMDQLEMSRLVKMMLKR